MKVYIQSFSLGHASLSTKPTRKMKKIKKLFKITFNHTKIFYSSSKLLSYTQNEELFHKFREKIEKNILKR